MPDRTPVTELANRALALKSAIELATYAVIWEKAHGTYFPSSAKTMAELGSSVLLAEGIEYLISFKSDSITCVKCRRTSSNSHDVENRYCGFCHVFHREPHS